MPEAVKTSANMTKHQTKAELEARQQAEAETMPRRQKPKLKKPGFISGSKQANTYWNQILKRMDGLALLDDLDSEMLAGYCSMLARRDETILLADRLTELLGVAGVVTAEKTRKKSDSAMTDEEWESSATPPALNPDEIIEAIGKLNTLHGKLQALDRTLLQYAEKLGLTPSGRVRLAQKRAQAAAELEPDSDLFGD